MNSNIMTDYKKKIPWLIQRAGFIALIIIMFKLIGMITLLFLLLFNVIKIALTAGLSTSSKLQRIFTSMLILGGLFLFIQFMGARGVWGFIIMIIVLAAFRIWMSRELFMQGIRDIETMIWGSPAEERWKKKKRKQ